MIGMSTPAAGSPAIQPFRKRGSGETPARRDLLLVLLVLLAVNVAGALLLMYVYLPARRREAFAASPAQLSLIANDRQHAIRGWVQERLADTQLSASLLANARREDMPALLARFITAYGYESAFIVESETIAGRHGRVDIDDATVIAFAREAGPEPIIDFRRTIARKPKILTSCRFGSASTVVFVTDPYLYIYPLLSTYSRAAKTGETNLIGLYGEWGVALNPYPEGFPPPMTVRRPIPRDSAQNALARGEQTIRYVDRREQPVIAVVKAIPGTPWVVAAKIDEAEVNAGPVAETVRLGVLLAVLSCALAAVAFAILRSRRVHRLRQAEDQLARLFAQSTTGILVLQVIFDERGKAIDHAVVDMNPEAERLLGVTAGAEIGRRSADAPYLQWPEALRDGNYKVALTGASIQYERYDPATDRWFETRSFSPQYGRFAQLLTDVTERRKNEEAVRKLSARLLRVQDDERRRVARQLHETISQSLSALRMNLSRMRRSAPPDDGAGEIISDSMAIADDAITEVRTMSYLLHPPMIDHSGLLTTLRWYVEGFEQRSGIATTLDVPDDLGRLSHDVETSVFRIVQESLTNVQRHAGSATARVRIDRVDGHLSLEIADQGRGLPPPLKSDHEALLAAGVGIAGINERVHELHGEMSIQSSETGTKLRVTLPVDRTSV